MINLRIQLPQPLPQPVASKRKRCQICPPKKDCKTNTVCAAGVRNTSAKAVHLHTAQHVLLGGLVKEDTGCSLRLPACKHRDRSPSPMRGYLIPSPLPTRRNRTCSASARASEGPLFSGVCRCFSRSKGHGFIIPADGGTDIFVHISDIEGEYVPAEGDQLSYKVCSIPPKYEKVQAVEVSITQLKPGIKHETWSGTVVSS
ncbi:Calcium-regulated heat stable protein 1 [Merluccius polli]|uniref:Calcium-regulated heat stable protein 1 n=1 Tax=Merluccius polli TaxID=89951 RepID=A0AA47MZT4_MERPO|nr:Calcium-regulated heat stable protein 1 [Merluccius polli]